MHLIYLKAPIDKRIGGPSGYLGYLSEYLNNPSIIFVGRPSNGDNLKGLINFNFKKYIPKSIKIVGKRILNRFSTNIIKNYFLDPYQFKSIDFTKVDSIHFHSTLDMFNFVNYNRDLSKKIIKILTSHSPEMPALERIRNFDYLNKREYERLLIFLKEVDTIAFKEADYLIFPSKNSLEPYYQTFDNFKDIIKNKKIKFLYTGVEKLSYKLDREEFRKRLNLRDEFLISYVGRHNKVKGYDILQEVAKIIWKENPDIYFIIAGREEPIKGLKDNRWIEIGWTDDPGSIINASDLFVLPNRYTFFDLVLLEVLSLGKVAVVSNTGGNKDIIELTKGIIGFEKENIIDLKEKILMVYKLSKEERVRLGSNNEEIWHRYFTVKQMVLEYYKILNEIYEENYLDLI